MLIQETTESSGVTNEDILLGRAVKKNAFRRITPRAYHVQLIKQIEANILAIAEGDIVNASMAGIDDRTGAFKLRLGLGGKNEYVENEYHDQHEFMSIDNIGELRQVLRVLLKKAKDGEFDDALAKLCEKRQAKADKMVAAQTRPKGVFGVINDENTSEADTVKGETASPEEAS